MTCQNAPWLRSQWIQVLKVAEMETLNYVPENNDYKGLLKITFYFKEGGRTVVLFGEEPLPVFFC